MDDAADALKQEIERVKTRWMTGGAARDRAPRAWAALLEGVDPTEAELRLAALVGQASIVALEPAPPARLTARADAPRLDAAPLEGEQRSRFRRVFVSRGVEASRRTDVLAFLAARGYCAHPADWMPSAAEAASAAASSALDLYAPWIAWAAARGGDQPVDALTEETWDDASPAERRAALRRQRALDPASARALLEATGAGESAEQRCLLVGELETGLSEADAAYLESLAQDRSAKVRKTAAALLARLGRGERASELEAELADFMSVEAVKPEKAKSAKAASEPASDRRIVLRRLKTQPQRARRAELVAEVTLEGLSAALELSPEDFLRAWDFDAGAQLNAGLARMVADTAPDALVALMLERWLESAEVSFPDLEPLLRRSDAEARRRVARALLGAEGAQLDLLVSVSGHALGWVSAAEAEASPAFDALLASLTRERDAEKQALETRRDNENLRLLTPLGLLLTADAAASALARVVEAGVMAADPHLDMLRLNILTPPRS